MSKAGSYAIHRLAHDEIHLFRDLMAMFGEAFHERETYLGDPPGDAYVRDLLARDDFVPLVALHQDRVVGGLVAYVLRKFEQQRSEVYIYDLATAREHRRRGVATALIEELKRLAKPLGAHVVFVQADLEDEPAIALYGKLGRREDVLHFDIGVE